MHCTQTAFIQTFSQDLQACIKHNFGLQVLLDRLRNEITRLTAVKAFALIGQSSLDLDLRPVLEPLLAELTSFLRKANRVLRQASLAAIEVTAQAQAARCIAWQ